MAAAAARVANNAFKPSLLFPGQTIVECRWWSGRYILDQNRFRINGYGKINPKIDLKVGSTFHQELQSKYDDVGLIHVYNTGLTDMADQKTLANLIMKSDTEYEGGANPR